ncbi:MAG: haloacid dehalogenase [Muricauda sp.]|jgi:hypothetical protein|nr:HAD family hydrolase [Allomuricauda sp.]MBC29691.1 haloacid dehalogenase [Allomuricauda sp.]|tara:strand:- start:76 stop:870 length:795 start_codon:yes stop_codon:yes gene_type:complete
MDLSKIKMVVTDMDGTLLNPNHEVSERFFELFEALRKKNIQFVAASGRQYNSMAEKLETVKDDTIFIAENGALVMHREKQLLVNPLMPAEVGTVLKSVKGIDGAHPVLCCNQKAFVTGHSRPFVKLLREYYSCFEEVNTLESIEEQVLKVAVYHFEGSEAYIYPHVKHLESQLKVKVSGTHWVDFSNRYAHKGHALEMVMKDRGISKNEVMVFGDYFNDVEMMQLSLYSFAMANAHPEVKKVAQFETASNEAFGVEKVLEKLVG